MSIGISDAQLDGMRAQVALMLPGTAVISEKVMGAADPYGGTVSWSAVAGGTVSCRVDPLGQNSSSELDVNLSKETLTIMYQCTLPWDAPIVPDNRLTIAGEDYEVVQMSVDHSWNVSKRCIITRVE